jgi:hypothetical protein
LVGGSNRRSIGSRCLLERMHEASCSMATASSCGRELRSSTGRSVVISSSTCLHKPNIMLTARCSPILIYAQDIPILLSSWAVQIQRVLFTLRQFPKDGFDPRPRLSSFSVIARHSCTQHNNQSISFCDCSSASSFSSSPLLITSLHISST